MRVRGAQVAGLRQGRPHGLSDASLDTGNRPAFFAGLIYHQSVSGPVEEGW